MRAHDNQAITCFLDAESNRGISRVELYIFEYELFRNGIGVPSQRKRPAGTWGLVNSWDMELVKARVELQHVLPKGFPAATRLEYVWRVYDADGKISDRLALTDAGSSPWPDDKVLLYASSRAPMADLIDISFLRDSDYGDDTGLFYADAEKMVNEGYFGSSVIAENRRHWAFYLTERVVDGQRIANDVTNENLFPAFLKDFSIPGIDAFCLLHREEYVDRSLLTENFHSLSNSFFSSEAYHLGTAVHETGHAIFHLSDEYGGCACFQTRDASNVFRDRKDCVAWNIANGFPGEDCFEIRDMHERSWFSAEEPSFFASLEACQAHNARMGLSADSCRSFYDFDGIEQFWSFQTTCIMHDDGDRIVRPFQRACRRVIEDHYREMAGLYDTQDFAAATSIENIYGYQPVIHVDMMREGQRWQLDLKSLANGVPSRPQQSAGQVNMRLLDEQGNALYEYQLANPGAVHRHRHAEGETHDSHEDEYTLPQNGRVMLAIPADPRIARVSCQWDAEAQERSADAEPVHYRQGYVFDISRQLRQMLSEMDHPQTPAER